MPFVTITPPIVGQPTQLDLFAIPVIDDLNYLNGALSISKGSGIINGSFEIDAAPNSNTPPTEWNVTAQGGDTYKIENTSGNVHHGGQAFSCTAPVSNPGGVLITTADYYLIGEEDRLVFYWWMMSTVANVTNTVTAKWYDLDENYLSSTVLYTSSSVNPTTWTHFSVSAQAPTGARFFTLSFMGVNSSVAGTTYWDGISYEVSSQPNFIVFTGAGTVNYYPSRGVSFCKVTCVGSGCAGNSAAGANTYIGGINARGGPTTSSGVLLPILGSNSVQFGSSNANNGFFQGAANGSGSSNGGGYAGEVAQGYMSVAEGLDQIGSIGAPGNTGPTQGYAGCIIIEEMLG